MNLRISLIGLALGTCMALTSSASTIQLGINGDAKVGTTYIQFGQYPNGAPYTPYPGYGTFETSLVNPGVFASAGVTTGEFGNIQSLDASAEPPGAMLNPTPGSSLPFMTFDTGGAQLQLYLTELLPGTTAGPFTITDTPNGAIAAFNVDGFTYNTITMQRAYFTGTFSATFNGESSSELLSSLPVESPFSATFSATFVPEPSSLLLMGLGLAGAGIVARRKVRS